MQSPHTSENWTEAAAEYDEKISGFTGAFAQDVIDFLDPSTDGEALEVAAGPGVITVPLSRRCKSVLATDYSTGMIERLRLRLEREGITNVTCSQMDGQALGVSDASFDFALCNFGLMLFDDRAAGFRELCRSLRPGGRAVVSAWSGPEKFEPFGVFGAAVQKALPDMPAPPGPPPIFSLSDPASFKSQMEAAGFTDVRIELVSHDNEHPSVEVFWDMMRNGAPPARMLFSRIGEDGVSAVRDALFEILRERFGDGPIKLAAEATIGIGTSP